MIGPIESPDSSVEQSNDLPRPGEPVEDEGSDSDDLALPRPQFGLRALLLGFSAIALLFALLSRIHVVWGAVVVWLTLLVGAHVGANAMGTRAAARAPSRFHNRDSNQPPETVDPRTAFAPTTRLGGRGRFGSRFQIFLAVGAIVGCVVGTMLVYRHTGGRLGLAALTLAAASSAGVGAFLAFLSGSCLKVTTRAWREATAGPSARQGD